MSPHKKPQAMRCAIYTRKSTEEGLEQAFNTLDAQLEAGETSLRSQRHQGCCLVPKHFDDGRLADDGQGAEGAGRRGLAPAPQRPGRASQGDRESSNSAWILRSI